MKAWYRDTIRKLPGGKTVYRVTRNMKDWVKRALMGTTIFENMGFAYLGPVDGHDVSELISVLRVARDMNRPTLLHVVTRKGMGYAPAEQNPAKFHGIGKFDPATGTTAPSSLPNFSQTFGRVLTELAAEDSRICAVTAAMPGGTGLLGFKEKFPNRLFDVGIAEEHAVSMAGGLAKQGMIPVVAIYSTFLQRAYDQILQDTALLKLPVIFAVDRAGLVGEDGETHHGVFDVGYLGHVPGMTVLAPASCAELEQMLRWAVKNLKGPVAIRYPRGGDRGYDDCAWNPADPVVCHGSGSDFAIVTYGTLVNNALEAAQILARRGKSVRVLRLTQIHPLPVSNLETALVDCNRVLVMEETAAGAGIHEKMAWELAKTRPGMQIQAIDLGSGFVSHGNTEQLYRHCGLDAASVAEKIGEVLSHED
jgi:1-deoxy-D-xylulose-5-phosphate synthase